MNRGTLTHQPLNLCTAIATPFLKSGHFPSDSGCGLVERHPAPVLAPGHTWHCRSADGPFDMRCGTSLRLCLVAESIWPPPISWVNSLVAIGEARADPMAEPFGAKGSGDQRMLRRWVEAGKGPRQSVAGQVDSERDVSRAVGVYAHRAAASMSPQTKVPPKRWRGSLRNTTGSTPSRAG